MGEERKAEKSDSEWASYASRWVRLDRKEKQAQSKWENLQQMEGEKSQGRVWKNQEQSRGKMKGSHGFFNGAALARPRRGHHESQGTGSSGYVPTSFFSELLL